MARFNSKAFATVSLGKDDEQRLTEWIQSEQITGVRALDLLTGDGYKISISWVDNNQSFCTTVIGQETTKYNKDSLLTGWSDDLEESIIIAAYKHVILCERGEWPVEGSGPRWG